MKLLNKIHQLYINPCYLNSKVDKTRSTLVLNSYLVVVLFAFSYTLISLIIEFDAGFYITLVLGFAYLVAPFILRVPNKIGLLAHFFMITSSIATFILIYYSGGLFSAITPWLAITPVMALLLLDKKSAWFWTVIMILVVYAFAIPQYQGHQFDITFNKEWVIPFDAMALSGFVLVIFLCNLIFETGKNEAMRIVEEKNLQLTEQQDEISASNEELFQQKEELATILDVVREKNKFIEKQNDEVKASILYASRIQNALLPIDKKIKSYFNDEFFILNKPRDIVSGDFYWFEKLEDCAIIVTADCTGHGVPGAFMSMLGVTGLNSIVFQEGVFRADKILNHLHDYIYKSLQQDQGKSSDGMDVSVLVIYDSIPIAEFAGAMSSIYCIQNNELKEIEADKKPIDSNHYGKDRQYTKQVIDISKPTVFYTGSDGYQDQFGGKAGRKFMKKNLKKLALEHYSQPFSKQKETFSSTLENWIKEGNEHQIDDILLMGFKVDRSPKNLKD